jgi:DNA-binding MarR family transcriptional regulator
MKFSKLDKKVLKFAYSLEITPGYTKRKSLLHYLKLTKSKLDKSINRLKLNGYIKEINVKAHEGVCYKLTEAGIQEINKMNQPIIITIKENLIISSLVALSIYLFTYLMDIFKPEIRELLAKLFGYS